MLGTQLFATATVLMRSQILPPSEMKSLYGSMTRSAVLSLSSFRFDMLFLLRSPKFCVAVSIAGQVIQHARQRHFRFSGLEAASHRGFNPVLHFWLAHTVEEQARITAEV